MIVFLTTLLILLCLAVVLLILIQRTSGGMGSALGGGAADQYLGAGSAAQLSKLTVWGILFFFILSFGLYALYQSEAGAETELLRSQDIAPVILPGDVALPAPADSDATPSVDATPATPVPAQPVTSGNSSQ
ncbi:MAG: preprotein translocase subunit SecG [Opitutales bacterium]|jgi:protein translocase SecG subunit